MNNNIKINNIKNIKVLDIAASNKNTTSDFYVCNVNSMWNQVGKMNLLGKLSCLGYKKKKLKFRKLSKILDLDTNKRKVIKIDVEGHETEVINDLMHLIKNKKENNLWIVETDKMNIAAGNALLFSLFGLGFGGWTYWTWTEQPERSDPINFSISSFPNNKLQIALSYDF